MGSPTDNERLASLEAKLDYIVKSVDHLNNNLSQNYMPRAEAESKITTLEKKIEKLEAGPNKWLVNSFSVLAIIVAVIAIIL